MLFRQTIAASAVRQQHFHLPLVHFALTKFASLHIYDVLNWAITIYFGTIVPDVLALPTTAREEGIFV